MSLFQSGNASYDFEVGPPQEGFVRYFLVGTLVVRTKFAENQVVDVLSVQRKVPLAEGAGKGRQRVMIGRKVVLDESLVIEGEDRKVYAKKLVVARTLEKDGSIFKILDEFAVYCSAGFGMKIPICGETNRGNEKC